MERIKISFNNREKAKENVILGFDSPSETEKEGRELADRMVALPGTSHEKLVALAEMET